MSVSTAKTVREVAVEFPEATRIFERFGIDYCCGGNKSLEEACAASNLSVDQVLDSLELAVRQPGPSKKAATGRRSLWLI
jgi:regulator of cell morphogenesis and NO signaling